MSEVRITWSQARELVLARLRQWIESLPPAERALKILWGQRLLSPLDMLREVETLSDLGQAVIVAELNKIAETTGIHYIISG
jgi:hypothetical protein